MSPSGYFTVTGGCLRIASFIMQGRVWSPEDILEGLFLESTVTSNRDRIRLPFRGPLTQAVHQRIAWVCSVLASSRTTYVATFSPQMAQNKLGKG